MQTNEDAGAFTIPWTIGMLYFSKALCDLGEGINLMPLCINNKFALGDPMNIMVDRILKSPISILHDVHAKVESFIFPTDFVILDYEFHFEIPIILRRLFLATRRALVDKEKG